MGRAQSTIDYFILVSIVLLALFPLVFLSTEQLELQGESQLAETVQVLREGIISVNNLGAGAAKVVVVQMPSDVTESYADGELLYFIISGQRFSTRLPANIRGVLPINEGRHYINLYNDGDEIFLYQCGNGLREGPEQCDGDDAAACDSIGHGCIGPGEAGSCKCRCDPNTPGDCPTNNCVAIPGTSYGYCGPCIRDDQCPTGQVCRMGQCEPGCPNGVCDAGENCLTCPDCACSEPTPICRDPEGDCVECRTNDQCIARDPTTPICKLTEPDANTCVECTEDSQCDPDVCDQATNTCIVPCTDSRLHCNYPIEICDKVSGGNGHCRPCIDDNECDAPDNFCDLSGGDGVCTQQGVEICGDGRQVGSEQCDFLDGVAFGCDPGIWCNPASCQCGGPYNTENYCGDGLVDTLGGTCDNDPGTPLPPCWEQCDTGTSRVQGQCANGEICTQGCMCEPNNDYCGDGVVNDAPGVEEECDPPGSGGCGVGKYCTNWCACELRPNVGWCGDGRVDHRFEECDGTASPNGCPLIANGVMSCTADCRCYGPGQVPPPGSGDRRGGWQPPCKPQVFCAGFTCTGDCPPVTYCKPTGANPVCACQPEDGEPGGCEEIRDPATGLLSGYCGGTCPPDADGNRQVCTFPSGTSTECDCVTKCTDTSTNNARTCTSNHDCSSGERCDTGSHCCVDDGGGGGEIE